MDGGNIRNAGAISNKGGNLAIPKALSRGLFCVQSIIVYPQFEITSLFTNGY